MGAEKNLKLESPSSATKLNKSIAVDIYRPPPLRRSNEIKSLLSSSNLSSMRQQNDKGDNDVISATSKEQQKPQQQRRRERRPDRAVYIPRARRSQTTPPTAANFSSHTVHVHTSQNQQISKIKSNLIDFDYHSKNDSVLRKPSMQLDGEILKCKSSRKTIDQKTQINHQQSKCNIVDDNPNLNENSFCDSNDQNKPIMELGIGESSVENVNQVTNSLVNIDNDCDVQLNNTTKDLLPRVEDVGNYKTDSLCKCNIDSAESRRAQKEINRNQKIFTSDILKIPETIAKMSYENEVKTNPELLSPVKQILQVEIVEDTTEDTTPTEDNDEDWDSMFDENGECLNPKIIEELTASVGNVKIDLPKMDYTAFLTKQSILKEEEYPHVLEISNFPVEFKTQDLLMIFSQYKESGFDIKWVNDTHALAVFSSSQIAAEALTTGHPFVVLKPLINATVESRLKAKKCATLLQPYRPRPETCAALARRLVTGALGLSLKTAAAERENEKRVLREAKERKLLAAKNRDDVWES